MTAFGSARPPRSTQQRFAAWREKRVAGQRIPEVALEVRGGSGSSTGRGPYGSRPEARLLHPEEAARRCQQFRTSSAFFELPPVPLPR